MTHMIHDMFGYLYKEKDLPVCVIRAETLRLILYDWTALLRHFFLFLHLSWGHLLHVSHFL